jgi:hypothetical protein
MPQTPDRTPGPSLEEELQLDDRTADGNPTVNGAVRYVSGDIVAKTPAGVVSLTAGGSGLNKAAHDILRSLIHFIDNGPAEGFASGAFRETTGTVFPTAIVWWETAGKLKKIVEKNITYTGAFPTTIEWKVYDTDGTTVLATVTDTITYSGPFETSRTRAIA